MKKPKRAKPRVSKADVDILKERKAKQAATFQAEQMTPFKSHNNRSCILVRHNKTFVFYIEIEASGFRVQTMNLPEFASSYKEYDYPIDRICEKYLKFALIYGASEEVLEWLGQIITITKEEKEMAKKNEAVDKATGKKLVKKAKTETASMLFKRLIMEGKLTDDQIFAAVQKAFPEVEDKRRCYVTEYRSILRRKGMSPPDAVVDQKALKAKEKIKADKDKEKAKVLKGKEKVKAVKEKEKIKADKEKIKAKSKPAKSKPVASTAAVAKAKKAMDKKIADRKKKLGAK